MRTSPAELRQIRLKLMFGSKASGCFLNWWSDVTSWCIRAIIAKSLSSEYSCFCSSGDAIASFICSFSIRAMLKSQASLVFVVMMMVRKPIHVLTKTLRVSTSRFSPSTLESRLFKGVSFVKYIKFLKFWCCTYYKESAYKLVRGFTMEMIVTARRRSFSINASGAIVIKDVHQHRTRKLTVAFISNALRSHIKALDKSQHSRAKGITQYNTCCRWLSFIYPSKQARLIVRSGLGRMFSWGTAFSAQLSSEWMFFEHVVLYLGVIVTSRFPRDKTKSISGDGGSRSRWYQQIGALQNPARKIMI